MVKIIKSFKNGLLNKSGQYRYYKLEYMLLKENLASTQKRIEDFEIILLKKDDQNRTLLKKIEDLETSLLKEEVNKKTLLKKIEKLEGNLLQEKDKLRKLNTEMEKFCTVPNFRDLKLSLKGKDGYLFLINDGNNEIGQHFDQSYINHFKPSIFIENLKIKEEYCRDNNIKYFFFIVPDKSYVCRDLLPFDVKLVKRNYDIIRNLIPDFADKLDPTCYWKTDSHINFLGGKELSYHILNHIDKNFEIDDFNELISEQITINYADSPNDLMSPDNWSYSEEEKEKYKDTEKPFLTNKCLNDLKESIPEKFKFNSERETFYNTNNNGFTDLKVLILRDSSTMYLDNVLSIYFKEIVLYWDHWIMNKEIIEWFKPDVILEIRTERFLENMKI